jgi:hypothetical protein
VLDFFEQGMGPRLRAGVEALRRAHSWETLAGETLALIDGLAPARGWR